MKKIFSSLLCSILLAFAGTAGAVVIDFAGGTAYYPGGTSVFLTEDFQPELQGVTSYIEDGVKVEFLGGDGIIGSYYDNYAGDVTNNNVIHAHWWWLESIRFSMVDGSLFDLNYMDLTSNTTIPGGFKTGEELSYVTASNGYRMLLPSSDWGVNLISSKGPGDGIERLWMDENFDDILYFEVTSENAFCFGLDNFYINEPAPGDGGETPPVPEPGTLLLLGSGVAGLAAYRRKKRAA